LLPKRIDLPGRLVLGLDVTDCGSLIAEARVVQSPFFAIDSLPEN